MQGNRKISPGVDTEADPLAALMPQVAGGDQAAFARLYGATARRVYSLALRMVRDPAAAEEVAADVYLHAWRRAADYDASRGTVATWLLVICRSRALDALRSAASAGAHAAGAGAAGEDGAHPDPCDLLLATRESSRVHACIDALAPVQRQLLALAFFRGYSHAEIATFSGMPLGTVKSHLKRALGALQETLRDKGDA